MISSEKRIAANRRNARKSTGPKSEEGKSNSRRNALKHGLRSSGAVVHDDDQRALEREIGDWEAHFEPEGPLARALVRRAALSAVRLERCAREEAARLDERRRHAARRWHLDRRKEVEALAARLPTDPCRAAPALRATPEGCNWLMARWRLLRVALKGRGLWTIDEFAQALHLLGRSEQSHRRELASCRLTAAHLAAQSGRSAEEAGAAGLLSAEQGKGWLERRVVRELRRLRDQRDSLRADRRRDVGSSADVVLFDARPAAALMRRYESAALADLNRCTTLLSKFQPRDPGEAPRSRSRRPAPEPTADAIEPTPQSIAAAASSPGTPRKSRRTASDSSISGPPNPPVAAPIEAKSAPDRPRRKRGIAIVVALLIGAVSLASVAPRGESVPRTNGPPGRDPNDRAIDRAATFPVIAVGKSAIRPIRSDRSRERRSRTIEGARGEREPGQDGVGDGPLLSQGGPPRS